MPEPAPAGPAAYELAERRIRPFLQANAEGTEGEDALSQSVRDEVDLAARRLRARFKCIRDYDALSEADRAWFDTAAGLMAAVELLAPAVAGANDGLSKLRAGDFEYTFSQPPPGEQTRWAEELAEAVGNLSSVQRARAGVAVNINTFGVHGRTRARQEAGRYNLSALIAMLLPAGWGGDRRSMLTPTGAETVSPPSFF